MHIIKAVLIGILGCIACSSSGSPENPKYRFIYNNDGTEILGNRWHSFRPLTIEDAEGTVLAREQHRVRAENSDVIYIEDWTKADLRTFYRRYYAPNNCTLVIVGDVMLDRYWYGATSRISPEAPVPIVHVGDSEDRVGGAGNVAIARRHLQHGDPLELADQVAQGAFRDDLLARAAEVLEVLSAEDIAGFMHTIGQQDWTIDFARLGVEPLTELVLAAWRRRHETILLRPGAPPPVTSATWSAPPTTRSATLRRTRLACPLKGGPP